MAPPEWHGTPEESLALLEAINANCSCAVDHETGATVGYCGGHSLLQPRALTAGYPLAGMAPTAPDNQRALDGLLTYRHLRDRLIAEEQQGLETDL